MAAPKRNAMWLEETRKKAQASQLVNRLRNNALGKLEPEMSPSQVKSAEILLRKSIPDLSSVAIGSDHDGSPLRIKWED